FGVSNPDLFSDKFISSGSYPNPENSAVSAELFFDDGSQILTAESIKFFKGIVDSLGTVTYKNCPFKIKNIDAIKGKLVGDLITEADKTGTIPIPASSLGKMKPIIYGDHKFNYGGIESGVTEAVQIANLPGSDIYKNNLSPCVYIGLNSAGKHQYIVAGHALKTIGSAYFRAWTFDSNLNRMVRVDPTQVSYATVGTNVIATVDNNPTVEDFWYPDGTVSGEANVGGGDWETHGNSCDRDFASRSRSELVSGDIRFSKAHIEIDFPDYTNQSASPTAVEVYAKVNYYVTGGVGNDFNALLNTSAFDDITKSGDTRIIFAAETADLAGIENSVSIEHEKATVNTFTSHAYVYMIWKLIKYKLTANASFPLYVACEGREYGTWINGRSTAETDPEGNNYTETHADDDGATNLIENAAGVVESLLVDELGLADTEIFENSFNISSNDLSTSKLSFSILEQIESTKLIDDICKTIKSTYFFNARDLATIRTWVTGDPFSASGDSVPNNNDIYIHKPVKTFVIVTGSNDALDFSDGGAGDLLATIPADSYTGATLATAIDVALEAVGGDNYTVTYSSSTGKFTLVSAGIGPGDFELRWSSGGRAATSIGRFIGFDISADDTGALTYVGDYPLWVDSYVENPTKKPSYKKSTDKIYTDYTVKYYLDYNSKEYQEPINDVDNTYIPETIPETFLHPYTKDAVTAQIYMDHLKDRYNRKHI
ncbi:MAG: hypothetical protein HQ509_06680, partial [Candidatus Marinimicrobia bacterium]|nr:hypothetical protein [Candidatus Neomarinimicrobiota bacterium]